MQSSVLKPENRPYEARGAAKDLWKSADSEVLIVGPVGTGKSRACLEKIHFACGEFPGCRVLMARETRRSLSNTVMVTFEEHVLPEGHPLKRTKIDREHRSKYTYPNKSEIVLGGMDDVEKFMSGEYDIIYIPEATETREHNIDLLKTRLRNGVLPFQQMMLDANPGPPNHWLKKRCDGGRMRMLQSWLRDNPRFHDGEKWTTAGKTYLATLESLTGHRRDRLVHGIWKAVEGARFDGASREVQGFTFSEEFPHGIPSHWPRWLSGDYGHSDPYCCLWHAISPEGVVYTYLEDYTPGYEADQQGERVVKLSPRNDPPYQCMFLDQSMWSKEKSFGGDPLKGPAAEQYQKVFDAANKAAGKAVWGPLKKGAQNVQECGYITLDAMIRAGTWRISRACVNLWREIEDAVYYQDPRTGIRFELINPRANVKDCDDHALEASVYGIHRRSPLKGEAKGSTIDPDASRVAQLQEYRRKSEQRNRKSKPPWLQ